MGLPCNEPQCCIGTGSVEFTKATEYLHNCYKHIDTLSDPKFIMDPAVEQEHTILTNF